MNTNVRTLLVSAAVIVTVAYAVGSLILLDAITDEGCINNDDVVEVSLFYFSTNPIHCRAMSLSEIGDYVAGAFSLITIVWLIIAFTWQATELREQIKQFEATNEKIERRNNHEDRWQKIAYFRSFLAQFKNDLSELELLNKTAADAINYDKKYIGVSSDATVRRALEYYKEENRRDGIANAYSEYLQQIDDLILELGILLQLEKFPELLEPVAITKDTLDSIRKVTGNVLPVNKESQEALDKSSEPYNEGVTYWI